MAAAAISGDPARVSDERRERVLVVLIPLGFVAAAVLLAAGPELARFLREGHVIVFMTLVAAALAAEVVGVELVGVAGSMSFELVVVVSAAILYGAAVAVVVAAVAALLVQFPYRRPMIVRSYNTMSVILQAGAAGTVAGVLRGSGRPAEVILATGAASSAWILVNVTLGCAVIVRVASVPKLPALELMARELTMPFLFMTSLVALVVVAWRESPILALAAVGPVAGIRMYQSRRIQAERANMMALTDPLTQIGNRRHFDQRLAAELERAERLGSPFSLCLLDLDDFKTINDTYGHAVGDVVLAATASCLRRGGEAFRCGGDEFALLLPGYSRTAAAEAVAVIRARIGELTDPGGRPLVVSVGIATSPPGSSNPAVLLRAADIALYARKRERATDVPS